jgi:pimeloyl-ACP methyl ester carboxylesterase
MAIRRTLWNAFTAAIATTSSPRVIFQELKIGCSDGTKLAAQSWASSSSASTTGSSSRTVLCIHGWMDNCRSFHQLAPRIIDQNIIINNNNNKSSDGDGDDNMIVIALDLPGHGRSSHKSIDAPPMVQSELAYYVSEAVDYCLQQQRDGCPNTKVTLIGHSLGAGIASLYASSFPEHIDQLILLDGAGFLARDAQDTSLHVRNHIRRRKLALSFKETKRNNNPRGYPSLDAAVKRRVQSMKSMPGNQTLSFEAARELVLRGTHLDSPTNNNEAEQGEPSSPSPSSKSIQFRHDSRFAWPSIQYMTQEQNEGIFRALGEGTDEHRVDCCILLAENGWPFRDDHLKRAIDLIQPRTLRTSLPGSHYFHADPETSQEVVDAVLEFLSTSKHPTTVSND